jgi:hypothetical protein
VRALGVSLGGAMAWSQSRWITVGHCSPVITWLSLYFKVSSSRNAQDHGCWMFFVWYQNSSQYCTLWRREKSQEICATRIPIKTPTSLKKVAAAKVVWVKESDWRAHRLPAYFNIIPSLCQSISITTCFCCVDPHVCSLYDMYCYIRSPWLLVKSCQFPFWLVKSS